MNSKKEGSSKKQFLYITPGPLPPNKDPKLSKLYGLSDYLSGDILAPVWWKKPEEALKYFGENNYPIFKVGEFSYHLFLLDKYPTPLKPIAKIIFLVAKGISLRFSKGKFDYIMSYGTNATGIAGVILKYIHGAKFIAEIPGVPEDGSQLDSPSSPGPRSLDQITKDIALRFVVSQADHTKLLYESQLAHYPTLSKKPTSIFHDFVPTKTIESLETSDQKCILLLGFPWYRKGVDVLIKAFLQIADKFPNHHLICAGWYPDKEYITTLAENHPHIHISEPVPALECYSLIASCSVLVLPSRSEAMGRVLLEAMAAKKPIIGSDTNGIPTYLHDGKNGLLVPPDNINALAEALSTILSDPSLAEKMGLEGYEYLKNELDEQAYTRKFLAMLSSIDQTNKSLAKVNK